MNTTTNFLYRQPTNPRELLLDYLRFVPTAGGGILVPDEPTADLKQLVRSVGFKLVFRDSDRWVVVD